MEHEAYLEMAESEAAHWWFQGRRKILAAIIGGLNLPASARILELGSGSGGNFDLLSRFGELTAVEMNDTARAVSVQKSAGAVTVLAGVLPDGLPAFAEKFDLICLLDVLEHVEQDMATLVAIKALLAPAGAVVITVPAFTALWGPHDDQLHHKRRYRHSELKSKLLGAGFHIDKLSYCNMLLFPAGLAVRLGDQLAQLLTKKRRASGTGILPYPLNGSFAAIFGAERFLLRRRDLPIGLSLLAVVRAERRELGISK
jgi:SAM-dependent methyltransferase